MNKQNYELKNDRIRQSFEEWKRRSPDRQEQRLNLSWSNWGFGLEPLQTSCERLRRAGIRYIELHGNHYGPDLGYSVTDTQRILDHYGLQVSGVCGMFSPDQDLSSNRAVHRQAALDYLKREVAFTHAMGGGYLLVVPGAVGRPQAYDDTEFERSSQTLALAGQLFEQAGIQAAIEPIRSDEVSLVHTIADAKTYIEAVNHPGIRHINADAYHMQSSEAHIGEALLDAGEQLANLHMADSNRGAMGSGSMDLDTIIMSLYVLGFNRPGRYVTFEPLGPGADPYPAMHGKPDAASLDRLVAQSAAYFREREQALLGI